MARVKNAVKTVQITVSVTEQMFDLLGKVARSGYSARTEAAVAEEMLRKGMNADGLLSELMRKRVMKGER